MCTKLCPAGKLLLKMLPSVALSATVCATVPTFCQHTDCPCVIVTEPGVKAMASVALTVAAAPLLPQRFGGLVELPHEDSAMDNRAR